MFLKNGESKQLNFLLKHDDLLQFSEEKEGLAVLPGKEEVMIGASSKDIRMQSSFLIK